MTTVSSDKISRVEYGAELSTETLAGMPTYYYPGASTQGGKDGLIVRVTPKNGEPWLGVFAPGTLAPNGVNGIFAMPDGLGICVVSNGRGYIVRYGDPLTCVELPLQPITDIRVVPEKGLIVFADLTRLVAYSGEGVKWETGRLAFDGFDIVELSNGRIVGKYYDIRSEADEVFEVDLDSGNVKGGVN